MASIPRNMPMVAKGHSLALGCTNCFHRPACGGLWVTEAAWDCFTNCGATCQGGKCDYVCPHKDDYVERVREVGGFLAPGDVNRLRSPKGVLPRYVPIIGHGHARTEVVTRRVVALSTFRVLRSRPRRYGPTVADPADLRAKFGLAHDTEVLLVSVAKDRPLETYWRQRRMHDVPAQLARLGLWGMTTPNYSLFLDAPGTHRMFNRTRTLRTAEELSQAGVGIVLHLNASSLPDWEYWGRLLRAQAQIRYVAKEFQTGLVRLDAGRRAIEALERLQEVAGRELHLVAVGAGRYLPELTRAFDNFTLVDSVPFMATMHRKLLTPRTGKRPAWRRHPTEPGEPLDELLWENLARYEAWLTDRLGRRPEPRTEEPALDLREDEEEPADAQLLLPGVA